jgi:Ham1 family
VAYAFIDAGPLRIAEVCRIAPGLVLEPATLPAGFAAASPEPAQRARDVVLAYCAAHGGTSRATVEVACVAEATDLTTVEGRSLRLELDSENDRRFTRYWRETPARLHLCVALRRAGAADLEIFTAVTDGQIADKPAGDLELGWDRLFVPAGHTLTLAQLVGRGELAGPRPAAWAAVAAALATQRTAP